MTRYAARVGGLIRRLTGVRRRGEVDESRPPVRTRPPACARRSRSCTEVEDKFIARRDADELYDAAKTGPASS